MIHIFRKLQSAKAKINKAKPNLFGTKVKVIEVLPIGEVALCNHFHPYIWESHIIGMRSPVQSFYIDKSLKKVMLLCLKYRREISKDKILGYLRIVNGTQMCSNFRPAAAKAIYDYFKPCDVLDMSAGYGGRLIGFLASDCKGSYTGVDPSKKSCESNERIAEEFGASSRVKIICSPFEDVQELPKVDLAFTSTPYFSKEIYESDNPKQSRERYPEYKSWLKGFLKPMMKKTRESLRPKGIMALNIADVKIGKHKYPLAKDTVKIAHHVGFELVEQLEMVFSGFGKGLAKWKTEPIFIFKRR